MESSISPVVLHASTTVLLHLNKFLVNTILFTSNCIQEIKKEKEKREWSYNVTATAANPIPNLTAVKSKTFSINVN